MIDFKFTSSVRVIQETATKPSKAIIEGVLISEGTSRNGNLYTIEELENIASQAEGKPIFYGTKAITTNYGTVRNVHDERQETKIGKILRTTFDKLKRKVFFVAEIVNTPRFPDIVSKVKSGFGISISGFVEKANYVLDRLGKAVLKIKNMVVESVQLIEPSVKCGDIHAKVEAVHVEEVMTFSFQNRVLSKRKLALIVSALASEGLL